MKIWKHTPLDAIPVTLSVAHFAATLLLAVSWEGESAIYRVENFALLVFMMVYSIIVVCHLFTHAPWFESRLLNRLASMLNSVNIGQSGQAYHLTHVRNHHRYNNDRKGPDGKTKDLSSTFQDGVGGEHASLFRYAFLGAVSTLLNIGRALLSVGRLWRVGEHESELLALASATERRRAEELRQLQLDRMAQFLMVCLFLVISWKWTLLCYLPAFYLALALVNVQNYYEHYGAAPGDRYADSVSYYGTLYNLLTFNDGYHQEHHLRANAHWRTMPSVRLSHGDKLDRAERIISPVPALLGFLHRNRELLHRRCADAPATPPQYSAANSAADQDALSKTANGA